MASRWLHLGLATVGCLLLGLDAGAQPPSHEREGGLMPPTDSAPVVVQVVAKQPLDDEEEILVEVIKAMPRAKSEAKALEEEKKENFKVIKVKKELTEQPVEKTPPKVSLPVKLEKEKTAAHQVATKKESQAVKSETTAKVETKAEPKETTETVTPTYLPQNTPGRMFKSPLQVKNTDTYGVAIGQDRFPAYEPGIAAGMTSSVETFALPRLSFSNVGWIDPALIGTQARLRYDARFSNKVIDRAEFYTARNQQYFEGTELFGGRGYPLPESNVDMQEAVLYLEYALSERFSVFGELPARFMSPTENERDQGLGDFNFGFKLAYFALPDHVQTFQFRIYTQTGSPSKGLGVGHATLEPGLLLWQRFSSDWTLEAELRDWIPVGGSNYAGNTLRYALGLSYDLFRDESWSIKPVTELIGWSVLRGKESRFIDSLPTFISVHDASGTILESAWGVRGSYNSNCDWYLGYSFNLTNKAWFENNLRLEVRWHY